MGVTNLWALLEPCGRRIDVQALRGKRLAVDASGWIFKFIKAMRDDQGELLPNAHLIGFFRRICKLLFHNIRPIFIFDGSTPALKRHTVIERRRRREQQEVRVRKTAEKLLLNRLKQHALAATDTLQAAAPAAAPLAAPESGTALPVMTVADLTDEPGTSRSHALSAQQQASPPDAAAASEEAADMALAVAMAAAAEEAEAAEEDLDLELLLPEGGEGVDAAVLSTLPPSVQLEVMLRLRERQRTANRSEFEGRAGKPADFSQYQMEQYLKASGLRRQLDGIKDSMNNAAAGGGAARRIAAEEGREYFLHSEQAVEQAQRRAKEAAAHAAAAATAQQAKQAQQAAVGLQISFTLGTDELSDGSLEWEDVEEGGGEGGHGGGDPGSLPAGATEEDEQHWRARAARRQRYWSLSHGFQMGRKLGDWAGKDAAPEAPSGLSPPAHAAGGRGDDEDAQLQEAIRQSLAQDEAAGAAGDVGNMQQQQQEEAEEVLWVDEAEREPELEVQAGAASAAFDDRAACEVAAAEAPTAPVPQLAEVQLPPPAAAQKKPQPVSLASVATAAAAQVRLEAVLAAPSPPVACPPEAETLEKAASPEKAPAERHHHAASAVRRPEQPAGPSAAAAAGTARASPGQEEQATVPAQQPEAAAAAAAELEEGSRLQAVVERAGSSRQAGGPQKPPFKVVRFAEHPREAAPGNDEEWAVWAAEGGGGVEQSRPINLPPQSAPPPSYQQQQQQQAAGGGWEAAPGPTATAAAAASAPAPAFDVEEYRSALRREEAALRMEHRAAGGAADAPVDQMYGEVQELLQLFGLPFLIAPAEAEAQAAWLDAAGLVDGVVTDDNDAFLFGARRVYRNLFEERKYVEEYRSSDLEGEMGLDRGRLAALALLLGSDYTAGVAGVGVVNALEVLRAFPGGVQGLRRFAEWMEGLDDEIVELARGGGKGKGAGRAGSGGKGKRQRGGGAAAEESGGADGARSGQQAGEQQQEAQEQAQRAAGGPDDGEVGDADVADGSAAEEQQQEEEGGGDVELEFRRRHRSGRRSWTLPPGFPLAEVAAAYEAPKVDASKDRFVFGRPDLQLLRAFCGERFGWEEARCDELLLPVVQAFDQLQTQQTLDNFLTTKQRFAKIRSKRLQKAVAGIAGDRTEELMLEEEDATAAAAAPAAAAKSKGRASKESSRQGLPRGKRRKAGSVLDGDEAATGAGLQQDAGQQQQQEQEQEEEGEGETVEGWEAQGPAAGQEERKRARRSRAVRQQA